MSTHVYTQTLFVFKWLVTYHLHPNWIQIVFSNNFRNKWALLLEKDLSINFFSRNGWICKQYCRLWITVYIASSPLLASAIRFVKILVETWQKLLKNHKIEIWSNKSINIFILCEFWNEISDFWSQCIVQILLYWHPLPQDFGWNMTAGSRVRGRVVVKSLT